MNERASNPALRARVALQSIAEITRSPNVEGLVALVHEALDQIVEPRPVAVLVHAQGSYVDDNLVPIHLRCPACTATTFVEVDTAIRWTNVEPAEDGTAFLLSYDSGAFFESDHLRCMTCKAECEYPADWSRHVVER